MTQRPVEEALAHELEEAEWVIQSLANIIENQPTYIGDFFNKEDWERIAPWLGYSNEEDYDEDPPF